MAKIKTLLLVGLIVRLLLVPWSFHDDVTTNYWWGKFAVDFPLRGYYDWLEFGGYHQPDLPPLHILYHRIIRQTYLAIYQPLWWINTNVQVFPSKLMQWYFDHGNQALSKIPSILSDLILIYGIFKLFPNILKQKLLTWSLVLFPPLLYNSAVWGGNDSPLNLLGLASAYFLINKKYLLFSLFLTLCFLFKPSLFIFIPPIIIALVKNKPNIKNLIAIFIVSITTIYLVSRPFATYSTIPWFFTTYFQKFLPGVMSHLTSNAANLWALFFGLNPIPDSLQILPNISARLISLLITIGLSTIILHNLYRHYSTRTLLLTLVNLTLISFCFLTRMHERYTFPALIPLFILSINHRQYLKYLIILTTTHMLNVYNLWWYPSISPLITILKTDVTIRFLSFLNIFLTMSLFFNQITRREVKDC